jgi:short-subunit dehydrogenase
MGREFALQLSQYVKVDEIWAIARREEALKSINAAVPIRPIPLDLCDEASFARFADILAAEKPNVKLLVNAAGFGKFGAFQNVPLEDDLRMIDLNCKAAVDITMTALPYMRAGDRIIEICSTAAFQSMPSRLSPSFRPAA